MVIQCIAVGASLVTLWYGANDSPEWVAWTLFITVWLAIISTVYSGLDYVFAAIKILRD